MTEDSATFLILPASALMPSVIADDSKSAFSTSAKTDVFLEALSTSFPYSSIDFAVPSVDSSASESNFVFFFFVICYCCCKLSLVK